MLSLFITVTVTWIICLECVWTFFLLDLICILMSSVRLNVCFAVNLWRHLGERRHWLVSTLSFGVQVQSFALLHKIPEGWRPSLHSHQSTCPHITARVRWLNLLIEIWLNLFCRDWYLIDRGSIYRRLVPIAENDWFGLGLWGFGLVFWLRGSGYGSGLG